MIFDNLLSPSQQREWEKLLNVTVIDREEVILDIFAKRARTREAVMQVDLARMQYALPRMAGMWKHLDRHLHRAAVPSVRHHPGGADRRLRKLSDVLHLLRSGDVHAGF